MNVEKLTTSRNCDSICVNGFIYYRKRQNKNGSIYYYCKNEGCKAKITLNHKNEVIKICGDSFFQSIIEKMNNFNIIICFFMFN